MLDQKLVTTRKDLLDLSARNRLINTRRTASRSSRLEIVDEMSEEIFRLLVREKKRLTFLAKSENQNQPSTRIETGQAEGGTEENHARHVDGKLQTELKDESLQKKLLKLFYEARMSEEEQGVNTLYLAIGFLKWYESNRSDVERQAPLILVPVTLARSSANAKFRLSWDENEISTNLSLKEKLWTEFGIELPEIGELEDFSPSDYFSQVQRAIESKSEWEILPNDMVIWFFSFAKFLMYKDLDPQSWPADRALADNELIQGLLGQGFRADPPILPDEGNIDERLDPISLIHVVDADSSQTLAIEESKAGRNLVIQGPPGTGKSQTITNLIATAVCEGKKVLFVAEKMAALQVVHRRLESIGLGAICLELHSHKANKKAVLQELETTLELGKPKLERNEAHANELTRCRDRLNEHAKRLHQKIGESSRTTFQAMGEMVRLHQLSVKSPKFKIPNAEKWTLEEFRRVKGLVQDVASHLEAIGKPNENPWRDVFPKTMLPTDLEKIQSSLASLRDKLDVVEIATAELADAFKLIEQNSLRTSVSLANISRLATQVPSSAEPNALSDTVWQTQSDEVQSLVYALKNIEREKSALEEIVSPLAWDVDLTDTRRHLRAYGQSWFRIFHSKYRDARANLTGILKSELPPNLDDQLELVDRLLAVQQAEKLIVTNSDMGKKAFGTVWAGVGSDVNKLSEIVEWQEKCSKYQLSSSFYSVAINKQLRGSIKNAINVIRANVNELNSGLKKLFTDFQLDVGSAFSADSISDVPYDELKRRIQDWHENIEGLQPWRAFRLRLSKLSETGLTELTGLVSRGEIDHEILDHEFQCAYFEALIRVAFQQHPQLAEFSGRSHEQVLAQFQSLDLERQEYARRRVAAEHFAMLPKSGAEAGEIGIVKREIAKKRRHLPIRKLLADAGHAVQAIKPVFMMSPISVAQFLEPGVLQFDLLIIDEASQVRPVDALGAMARTKQVVVVGDERQLPPTNFFNKVTEDDGGDDDDHFNAADMESVLGLCAAQNINQRMLRWHYRSRHQSLIAVSNYEFYESKLFVVPSPSDVSEKLGLSFVHIQNGVFDRGKSRTNRIEASAVADAVIEHAQLTPKKSLGVAAFSVAQRDAILDEVELRRRTHPELEEFFVTGGAEPFFVKNIENVQGDERDKIIISVGYARDSSGYLSMSFGPLQNNGGERRLNVLISRAKEKCIVFSSITADDIDLNRARSRGVAAFKTFLTYARSGFLDVGTTSSERDFDSEFERQVAKAITSLGYEVHCQIGVAGFYVDLAVVDPKVPGRYLLGIECDGASYHSSRSARDRDRLRQAVLEDRGWIIHRIWSTDWFQQPGIQLGLVQDAIEEARLEWDRRKTVISDENDTESESFELVRHEQSEQERSVAPETQVVPYEEARITVDVTAEVYEIGVEDLGLIVESIVKIEGPIHQSELARRVGGLWGLSRTGSRVTRSVQQAVEHQVSKGNLVNVDDFISHRDAAVVIRSRANTRSAQLKKPELLPPTEIRKAIQVVVDGLFGIEPDDVAKEASLLFGFKAVTSKIKSVIQTQLDVLLKLGVIELRNGKLYSTPDCELEINGPEFSNGIIERDC